MPRLDKKRQGKVEMLIFLPGLAAMMAALLAACFMPQAGQAFAAASLDLAFRRLGPAFLLFGALCFLLLAWLAFGRYGNVRLGRPEDAPEFSYWAWIAMIFGAGAGAGLLVWSMTEPIRGIAYPPMDIKPFSKTAFEWSHMLPAFHWGFSAWAILCLPVSPIAYAFFARRAPALRASSALGGLFGGKSGGAAGTLVDAAALAAAALAAGSCAGLSAPLVSGVISATFGISGGRMLEWAVLAGWLASSCLALSFAGMKGIKALSFLKAWLGAWFLTYVLAFGPASFIFDISVNSLGLLFSNAARLSFETEPFRLISKKTAGAYPQLETVFSWCWWAAAAPMTAVFVARISKGRTLRELAVAQCVFGTLGCWAFLMVLGGYSLHLQATKALKISGVRASMGDAAASLAVVGTLPFKSFLFLVYAALLFLFLAAVLSAAAYSMASVCAKTLKAGEDPPRSLRILWAAALIAFGASLSAWGGERALLAVQAAAIACAALFMPIMLLMAASLIKSLREDFPQLSPPMPVFAKAAASGEERGAGNGRGNGRGGPCEGRGDGYGEGYEDGYEDGYLAARGAAGGASHAEGGDAKTQQKGAKSGLARLAGAGGEKAAEDAEE
jgi:BCCT family betaine/carnitine transporter